VTPATASLLRRHSPLASAAEQVRILEATDSVPEFDARLAAARHAPLVADAVHVLQVNVGKKCNQVCAHCHVDAGPDREEVLSRSTAESVVRALVAGRIGTLDITGGAPELNPNFRWLVTEARVLGVHVMDRCNLTILSHRGQEDLAEFLAAHRVEIVCSLPYYQERETDRQRGHGVFQRSIDGLRRLNALGYGQPESGLLLNLVMNPVGAYLPAKQAALEADFKRQLERRHGVVFNNLYTITNMPISRFLEYLLDSGNYEAYMQKLVTAFNPTAVPGLMCRTLISVGYDGRLYDCDFNQMLELPVDASAPRHIDDFSAAALAGRPIVTGRHCYGCTAGAGSSCGGATVSA
jgi:radical SAM/Cys-rich protein